jgi:hypothetical protein
MYAEQPHYREVLQGDVYRLTIVSTRFEANRPEAAFRLGAHIFNGDIEDQLFAVVSHDCDITSDKIDDKGRSVNPDKLPVVLGRVSEPDSGLIRDIEEGVGFEGINNVKSPAFYDMFYYPDLPGQSGNTHILNLSDLITVRWRTVRLQTKIVELDDQARFAFRVKLILHFGRGNDKEHPLGDFTRHLAETTPPEAPPKSEPPE